MCITIICILFYFVLTVSGWIGNASCVLTLRVRPLRGSGTAILLRALAITDSVCLGVGLLHLWLCELVSWDVRKMSDVTCRLHVFFTYLSVHVSAWTLVLLTAERLICVTVPLEASRLCSKRRLLISWWVTVFILAGINSGFHLAGTRLVHQTEEHGNTTMELNSCNLAGDKGSWMKEMRVWGDLLLSCLLPAIFILPANTVLMWRILLLAKKRRAMQQMNSNRRSGNKGKNQGITFMLVMACLMFLLTTLPINIYMLCQQYAKDTKDDVMSVARGELTYTLFSLLYYVNNAVNFAIYFLSGPVFRRAAMEVFCKKCIAARCAVNGSTQRTHMSAMTTIRSRGDMNLRQETAT